VTIIFPDVSEYEGAYNFAPYPLGVARATISTVKDRQWDNNVANAVVNGKRLAAYAFLNAPSLGVSVNAQADFAYSVVGSRPCMIDVEPNRGACASFTDVMAWIARYRDLGGVVNLCYLPRWSWSGNMGSPSLVPLTQAGVGLVSSNYTTYSDTGPGWTAYGGVTPIQWQFTDNLNGTGADGNAYRGTADQWWAMMTATTSPTRRGKDMIVMAHERGSNIDWIGDGIYRYKVVDSAHRANALVVIGLQGGNPTSVEFNPGTLDALGPVVVDASGVLPTADLAPKLDTLLANIAVDLAEDRAATAALKSLVDAVAAGGGSVDVTAILSAIADARQAESTAITALQDQNAALANEVADLQRRLAAAAQAQATALG